jgi:NarL family two-component system response regulator YdfI
MDLRMPEMDGLTAIKHLRADFPKVAVIILTTYNEDKLMLQGLQLGAHSYLLKDVDRQTLIRTIKAGAHGEILLQPEILQRIVNQGGAQASTTAPEIVDTTLTDREIEVIRRVAAGERNKEIAFHLAISESTVKAHLSHIFTKLDVDSRAGAVAVAAQLGLLPSKKR